jgi:hypothetical protein
MPLVIDDSVTHPRADARGAVAGCASHGVDAAHLAAEAGVGTVILQDAGIGKDATGVAGLADLDRLGVPAMAVAAALARIGIRHDLPARGVIGRVNWIAATLGIAVRSTTSDAVERLLAVRLTLAPVPPPEGEARHVVGYERGVHVLAVDSASLVQASDAGHIVLTGSDGGLLGRRPETAIKVPMFATVYNRTLKVTKGDRPV